MGGFCGFGVGLEIHHILRQPLVLREAETAIAGKPAPTFDRIPMLEYGQVWELACLRWRSANQHRTVGFTSRRKRHHPLVLSLAIGLADNPERLFTHRLTLQERIDLGIGHPM